MRFFGYVNNRTRMGIPLTTSLLLLLAVAGTGWFIVAEVMDQAASIGNDNVRIMEEVKEFTLTQNWSLPTAVAPDTSKLAEPGVFANNMTALHVVMAHHVRTNEERMQALARLHDQSRTIMIAICVLATALCVALAHQAIRAIDFAFRS